MTRIRRFCFTWNNYPSSAIEDIKEWLARNNARYAIIGKEVGASGTPHLQGYVMLSGQLRFSSIKHDFPTWHIEKARGTSQQNRVYCTKDNDFVEIGECPEDSATVTKNIWRTIYDLAAKGEWTTLQIDHPRVWIMMHEAQVDEDPELRCDPGRLVERVVVRCDGNGQVTSCVAEVWERHVLEDAQ